MSSSCLPISASVSTCCGRTTTRAAPASNSALIKSGSGSCPKDRDLDGGRIAPGSRGEIVEFGALVLELGRRDAIGQPAVGMGHNALQDIRGHAADDDRWPRLLRRLRERADLRELVVLALEFRLVVGPQRLHGVECFARLGPAPREIAAEKFDLFAQPAGADAE